MRKKTIFEVGSKKYRHIGKEISANHNKDFDAKMPSWQICMEPSKGRLGGPGRK